MKQRLAACIQLAIVTTDENLHVLRYAIIKLGLVRLRLIDGCSTRLPVRAVGLPPNLVKFCVGGIQPGGAISTFDIR